MLMYCALRFDGYRYQQETDFDYQTALSIYMSTGDWSPLNELEQLTVFFMLQRYLYKWGGDYLADYSPEWCGFRDLFFLNCQRKFRRNIKWLTMLSVGNRSFVHISKNVLQSCARFTRPPNMPLRQR